ncbi:hypothetical protein PNIG_a0500 [Pseudoalteromonas nigrifaciens]|uniref:Lipid A core - O-antigen ligase and related enzymes n=1 Tax=Pseudoalteromonas nigrifaciens TaxID=28109 RepID=A0AAC9UCH8_9GAMM|nr:hypothetical protein [Pseudoalteromonas nigrifaciens]ASM52810.1 hypothetical protein PNIG_a0500 [Pseudoalteromonas nigrifaciens]GEN43176.1 hypothetical protein PNI02_26420 [Pseudoalteromonas nigrifaciens]SUC53313.1 Lipid A core - O-antigen ligase and related enzymes [Pseudoalteromonas nigrifaciens]
MRKLIEINRIFLTLFFVLSSGTFISILYGPAINAFLAIFIGLAIYFTKVKLTLESICVFSLLFIVSIISFLLNISFESLSLLTFIVFFLKFLLLMFLCINDQHQVYLLLDGIFKWVFYFSCISISLYLIKIIFGNVYLPIYEIGEVKTYLFNTFYGVDFSTASIVRNSGIYYEPGVFGVFLCMALLWALRTSSYSIFKVSVILLNLLLTFSPVSIFLGGLIVFSAIKKKYARVILLIIIIIIFSFLVDFLFLKLNSQSFSLRANDLAYGWKLFLNQPIFGYSIFNEAIAIQYNTDTNGLARGSSNGILSMLYQTGAIFFSIYLYILAKGVSHIGNNNIWIGGLIVILLISQQPIHFSNVFILIAITGLSQLCLKKQ